MATKNTLHDLAAEDSTLGAILLDNSVMNDIHAILKPENFSGSKQSSVFRAMSELYLAGQGIDQTTLAEKLTAAGLFDSSGGDEFLISLVLKTPHHYRALEYANIVKAKSVRRTLHATGQQIVLNVADGRRTNESLIQDAVDSIHGVMIDGFPDSVIDARDEVEGSVARAKDRRLHGNPIPGVSTGLPDLDEMIGGYQDTHFIIVAGRPGSAKTTRVVNTINYLSLTTDLTTLFFSLEMRAEELIDKILAIRSSVDSKRIKNSRRLTDIDVQKLEGGMLSIKGSRGAILIDDVPGRNVVQIVSTARKYASMPNIKLGLVAIDYLQLIEPSNDRDSDVTQMTKISRAMKILGKTISKPVIGVSQLNRAAEGREDHRPMMSDLRTSGSLEQDADIVELLYRPDYYDHEDQPGIIETIVAKNRHGETGSVFSVFRKNYNQIISLGVRQNPLGF